MDRCVVYHNPGCGQSRGALDLVLEHGIEFEARISAQTRFRLATTPSRLYAGGVAGKLFDLHRFARITATAGQFIRCGSPAQLQPSSGRRTLRTRSP